jgi:hypothetical protein
MLECDNIKQLEAYQQEKEKKVAALKQRLADKGYSL